MTVRQLHPLSGLEFAAGSCLALRSRYGRCSRCQDQCPAAVLHLESNALRLGGGCLNCGRCAGACPTGALAAPGFAQPAPEPVPSEPITVECWKVPGRIAPGDAVRVPCLGGVSTGRWLALAAAADGPRVEAVDRGWCGACAAGGGGPHPATLQLAEANRLLEAAGVPEAQRIVLKRRPLPQCDLPPEIPDPLTRGSMDRRSFLRGLSRRAAVAAADALPALSAAEADEPAAQRAVRAPSPERQRVVAAIERIAGRARLPLPAQLFPALRVSDACANHNVCASVCPTGALAAWMEHAASGIAFDADACIACGDCERACPERAVTLLPEGDGSVPQAPARLTRFEERECPECQRPFAGGHGERLCGPCGKSLEFARSAFHQLFAERD